MIRPLIRIAPPVPRRIGAPLARVGADDPLPAGTFASLTAQAHALPPHASPAARELLSFWARHRRKLDEATNTAIETRLEGAGYPLHRAQYLIGKAMPDTATLLRRAVSENVTEIDRTFEAILKKVGRPTARVTAAAVDEAFDPNHPALRGRQRVDPTGQPVEWNAVGRNRNLAEGDPRHGSAVASILGRGNRHVDLVLVRAHDNTHPVPPQYIRDALSLAVKNGVKVVNMSFVVRGAEQVAAAREVIMAHPEVLFVKAAGNDDGRQLTGQRASAPEVELTTNRLPNLAVVAAMEMGRKGHYSNWGAPFVTHLAQAYHLAADGQGGYALFNGTSAAAPRLSSIATKMLAIDEGLRPEQTLKIIALTGDALPLNPQEINPNLTWRDVAASGTLAHSERALHLTALRKLVRGGMGVGDALGHLGVPADEAATLAALLPQVA